MLERLHVFTLIVGISRAFLITDRFKTDDTYLIEATLKLLNTCYGYRVNEIGLTGEAVGTFSKLIASQGNFSATILDDTRTMVTEAPARRGPRYGLRVFAIAVSSSSRLEEYIRAAKDSFWWNHMASWFIIETPSVSKSDCSKAHEMLWTAWRMNLIDAKFICHNGTEKPLIYGYNPYTTKTPKPWRFEGSYKGRDDHPWSLYVRNYRDDSRVCEELDFTKTNDLGGYTIFAIEKDWYNDWPANEREFFTNCTKGFDCFIVQSLSYVLNATFKILLFNKTANFGFVDENGRIDGMLRQIVRGDYDMGLNNRYQAAVAGLPVTYPHWQTGLSVVTRLNKFRSQLSKIMAVVDYRSRICIVAVYVLINPFFFIFVMRKPVIPAILNTIRVISYSCLPKLPRSSAPRIYLACLFFFMVTIEAIFHGKLASMLTRHLRHPQVNTLSDLQSSEHKIYGSLEFKSFFPKSVFRGRFVGIKNESCVHKVLHEPSVACVDDVNRASYAALKFKLHRSRRRIMNFYWIWVIREDWPLERRINSVVVRLLEAGLVEHSYLKKTRHVNHAFKILDDKSNDESAKVMTLVQLRFAFAILGAGLLVAATVFVVEVTIGIVGTRKTRRGRIVVG